MENTFNDLNRLEERTHELMWVTLDQLEFEAIIGIFPHERITTQPLSIALEMGVLPESWLIAATRGTLEESVDYSVVSRVVRELAEASEFRLIESLAYLIAVTLLRRPEPYEGRCSIERVRVTVCKPKALSSSAGGEPAVRLTLDRTSNLITRLFNDSMTGQSELTGLLKRLRATTHARLLVDLPEVQIAYVTSHAPDRIELSTQEQLISLGDQLQVETKERIDKTIDELVTSISWDREVTLLYIKRRALNERSS